MSVFVENKGKPATTKLEVTNQSVLASMLQSPSAAGAQPRGALISEVGAADEPIQTINPPQTQPITPTVVTGENEGPSLMELMMLEQKQAAATKAAEQEKKQQEEAKKGFGGFKKGFFGGPEKKQPSNSSSSSAGKGKTVPSAQKAKEITEVKAAPNNDSNKPFVFEEVQQALEEDQSSLLKQLKSQEWITPDLTTQFQNNKILAKGFQSQKCLAAIQLMQQNPKEAMARFKDDPEVGRFLQEFGRTMSAHFDALASQQQQSKKEETPAVARVEEIGPLQASAIKSKSSQLVPGGQSSAAEEEERRVQEILKDEELRTILMDADFQKVLMECGDPVKLRKHMQNVVTAGKIRKMQQAGLVKIEL